MVKRRSTRRSRRSIVDKRRSNRRSTRRSTRRSNKRSTRRSTRRSNKRSTRRSNKRRLNRKKSKNIKYGGSGKAQVSRQRKKYDPISSPLVGNNYINSSLYHKIGEYSVNLDYGTKLDAYIITHNSWLGSKFFYTKDLINKEKYNRSGGSGPFEYYSNYAHHYKYVYMLRESGKVIAELKTPYEIPGTQSEPLMERGIDEEKRVVAIREHNKDRNRNIELARKNVFAAQNELSRGWVGEHGLMDEIRQVYENTLREEPALPPPPPQGDDSGEDDSGEDDSGEDVWSYMKKLFDPCAEYASAVFNAFKKKIEESSILQKNVVLVAVLKSLPKDSGLLPEETWTEIFESGRESCLNESNYDHEYSELGRSYSAPGRVNEYDPGSMMGDSEDDDL